MKQTQHLIKPIQTIPLPGNNVHLPAPNLFGPNESQIHKDLLHNFLSFTSKILDPSFNGAFACFGVSYRQTPDRIIPETRSYIYPLDSHDDHVQSLSLYLLKSPFHKNALRVLFNVSSYSLPKYPSNFDPETLVAFPQTALILNNDLFFNPNQIKFSSINSLNQSKIAVPQSVILNDDPFDSDHTHIFPEDIPSFFLNLTQSPNAPITNEISFSLRIYRPLSVIGVIPTDLTLSVFGPLSLGNPDHISAQRLVNSVRDLDYSYNTVVQHSSFYPSFNDLIIKNPFLISPLKSDYFF